MRQRALVWTAASFFLLSAATVCVAADNPGGEASELVVVTATVEKIDLETREVTLKAPDGTLETVKVVPEARNLAQLKAGDKVTIKYQRAVAVFVAPPGETLPTKETTDLQRTPLGAKPGGQATNVIEGKATVEAVDLAKRTVTVRGPRGNVNTVKVGDQVPLDKIKAGDQIGVRYTEAVAVSVETP